MISQFLWQTILEEGERLGIPKIKKRALIREYLQSRIIFALYQQRNSEKLSFIGGTSLRLLRNLDRFSEDLDFDNLGLSFNQVKRIFREIAKNLKREGLEVKFDFKKTDDSGIGNFKFLKLLFVLKISRDKNEKLNIKINYTKPKIRPKTEVVVLKRFGFIQPVVTNTASFLLSQKIRASLTRKDIQPRDFYDIVWFFSQNIKPDRKLFKNLKVENEKELFKKLKDLFVSKVKPYLGVYKRKLEPFLINPKNVRYLEIFEKVVSEIS